MKRRGRPRLETKRVPIQISVPALLKERYLKLTEEQRGTARDAMERALELALDTLAESC